MTVLKTFGQKCITQHWCKFLECVPHHPDTHLGQSVSHYPYTYFSECITDTHLGKRVLTHYLETHLCKGISHSDAHFGKSVSYTSFAPKIYHKLMPWYIFGQQCINLITGPPCNCCHRVVQAPPACRVNLDGDRSACSSNDWSWPLTWQFLRFGSWSWRRLPFWLCPYRHRLRLWTQPRNWNCLSRLAMHSVLRWFSRQCAMGHTSSRTKALWICTATTWLIMTGHEQVQRTRGTPRRTLPRGKMGQTSSQTAHARP